MVSRLFFDIEVDGETHPGITRSGRAKKPTWLEPEHEAVPQIESPSGCVCYNYHGLRTSIAKESAQPPQHFLWSMHAM